MSTGHNDPNLPIERAAGPLCDAIVRCEEGRLFRGNAAAQIRAPARNRPPLAGRPLQPGNLPGKSAVPRSTVDRWLREQRREWMETAEETGGELFAIAMARLQSVYREAMHAWRRSLAGQEAAVDAAGDNGDRKPDAARTKPPSGQAALLGKAIHAAVEIARFHAKHMESVRRAKTAKRCCARRKLASETRSVSEVTT